MTRRRKENNNSLNKEAPSFIIDLRSLADKEKREKPSFVSRKSFKSSPKLEFNFFKNISFPKLDISSLKKRLSDLLPLHQKRDFRFYRNRYIIFRRHRRLSDYFRYPFHSQSILSSRRFSGKKKKSGKKSREEKSTYLVSWYRSLFSFALVLLVIIAPIKLLSYFKLLDLSGLRSRVMENSVSAFSKLSQASNSASQLDLSSAGANFAQAASDFKNAQEELAKVDSWMLSLASFSKDPQLKLASAAPHFLAAARAASDFGKNMSAAGAIFLDSDKEKSWGSLIDSFSENGNKALLDAKELQSQLKDINPESLPTGYRSDFNSLRQQTNLAVNALSSLLDSAKEIKAFLGVKQDQRYLLVFQNNAEMRGAGGFLGSYALVDISDGKIKKLEVPAGGSYDTEGGMKTFVKAPAPLQLVTPRWYFWDANWWPDWPSSAKALMWFYDKSGGPTVDGVISFTPDVAESLLRLTGPIELPEYGLTINADNFWQTVETTVEKDNIARDNPQLAATLPDSPENQPKKIIGDLMAKILERLPQVLTIDKLPQLLGMLDDNLASHNIMFYFSDPDLEAKIKSYGLDGAMRSAPQDYLMVADSNIAGQKSDREVKERIEHRSQILADGQVIDDLTVYRQHEGKKGEILSGVRNVDWLRVYVPEGSQLISASGFNSPDKSYFEEPESNWQDYPLVASTEDKAQIDPSSGTKIYQENNKTVFANWIMTDPGQTSIIHLRYLLPFKLKKTQLTESWRDKLISLVAGQETEFIPFSLLVQKQPGAAPADLDFSLTLPPAWRTVWTYPENSSWQGEVKLDRDRLRALLLEK